jgi:hypothetical protein
MEQNSRPRGIIYDQKISLCENDCFEHFFKFLGSFIDTRESNIQYISHGQGDQECYLIFCFIETSVLA